MTYNSTSTIETLEQIKKDYTNQLDALYTNKNTVWNIETGQLEDLLNAKILVLHQIIEKEKESNEVETSIEENFYQWGK